MVKNLVRFSLEWTSLISRKEKMMRSNRIYLTFQARTLGGEAGGHRVQVSGRGDISKWECSGTGRIWAYSQCPHPSLVAQLVKNRPAMRETWVQSPDWEDLLEKGKATHSSILAWRIPWTGSQRVR